MTTYCKHYKLTNEQKSLLKNLLIYQIGRYDTEKGFNQKLAASIDFLYRIDSEKVIGDISIMMTMENDIIKLCNSISDDERKEIRRTAILGGKNKGLMNILSMHSNETIDGLRQSLSSKEDIFMSSTSSGCW
jgi:hypothetical protein